VDFCIVIIIIIGALLPLQLRAVLPSTGKGLVRQGRSIPASGVNREAIEDKLFLASTRIVEMVIYQANPWNWTQPWNFATLLIQICLRQQIIATILGKTNQIKTFENQRFELQNSVFYVTSRIICTPEPRVSFSSRTPYIVLSSHHWFCNWSPIPERPGVYQPPRYLSQIFKWNSALGEVVWLSHRDTY